MLPPVRPIFRSAIASRQATHQTVGQHGSRHEAELWAMGADDAVLQKGGRAISKPRIQQRVVVASWRKKKGTRNPAVVAG